MRKAQAVTSAVDIDGCLERLADALGIEVSELIASERDDPKVKMLRKVAAYLLSRDQLPIGDIAKVLDKSETWVRDSSGYIERRIHNYYAFNVYIQRTIAKYELGQATGQVTASGIDIDGHREKIADAVGMTAIELVASKSDDPDAEMMQRVAAYLLLSRGELLAADVALITSKTEEWVRSSNDRIARQAKRNFEVRTFVEKAATAYASASVVKPEV